MILAKNIVFVGAQGGIVTEGFATMVVGISVVFIALIGLIAILQLSGKYFDSLAKKEAANKAKQAPVVTPQPVKPTIETPETDDLELIAVITAVIAASMGTSADNLQVRSLRKTNNVWSTAGRKERLYH